MTLRPPSEDDLRELAAASYFELSPEELKAFQALIGPMLEIANKLDQMPTQPTSLAYRDRDPGYRPSREEDPFNAIVRRCSVKGASSGKLAGKRIGLKDTVCMAGIPLTCGSLVMDGYVPEIDATIVTRILDAGGEIVAVLNMDDFACSGAGHISAYGPVLNPHNPERLAGGSSGGSAAALYYDDIAITIGGDQGGSIRIPASWSGVVGLKPTHGLVPYTGIVGADATIDHAGPMARSVVDVALMLEVIAGKDPLDPRQGDVQAQPYTEALGRDLNGVRIGILREGFGLKDSEPDVDEAVRSAIRSLEELGAKAQEVSVPAHLQAGAITWAIAIQGVTAEILGNGAGYHLKGYHNVGFSTALGRFRQTQANDFPPTVKLLLLVGSYLHQRYYGRFYAKAQNQGRMLRAAYDAALSEYDVLALPTTPMKAHRYQPDVDLEGLVTYSWSMSDNTAPFNVTGHPAISVPCAKSKGLPVGLMLVGRHFDEMTLLRVAHAFERNVQWGEKVS
jgi:amidase